MKHPKFTLGFEQKIAEARKHYQRAKVVFTGPDGRVREGHVDDVIFQETFSGNWVVKVSIWLPKLDGSGERLFDPVWARQYYSVHSSLIKWENV